MTESTVCGEKPARLRTRTAPIRFLLASALPFGLVFGSSLIPCARAFGFGSQTKSSISRFIVTERNIFPTMQQQQWRHRFALHAHLHSDGSNDEQQYEATSDSADKKIDADSQTQTSFETNDNPSATPRNGPRIPNPGKNGGGIGEYDPSEDIRPEREVVVGDPQIKVKEKERSVTSILRELAAIQQKGPQKYCILGTRHCSYLHQQIIELLAYALVLSGNHVYTSGAGGTHAATIRGALRAEREDLLTVVLPQSLTRQTKESQELLDQVDDVIEMPQNDDLTLDVASRICNSYMLSQTDQLIAFAFHESNTVIEATKEAKKLDLLVTTLYLD